MTIVLVARTLIALVGVALQIVVRKLSFDPFANLDDGELGRALKHGTGDQIAHAIGELFVDGLTTSLAHDGADHVLRILSSDATHVVRRNIALFEFSIFASFLVGFAHGNHLVHVDLARLAIDRNACIPFKIKDVLIALCQRCLKTFDQIEFVDLSFMGERLQSVYQF